MSDTWWFDSSYKDTPDRWGLAISKGDAHMVSGWFLDRTHITLLLSGDNYEIEHMLRYRSADWDINKRPDTRGL